MQFQPSASQERTNLIHVPAAGQTLLSLLNELVKIGYPLSDGLLNRDFNRKVQLWIGGFLV